MSKDQKSNIIWKDIDRKKKASYVRAAQREGKSLIQWLEDAADERAGKTKDK